jgi:hypothetical protein
MVSPLLNRGGTLGRKAFSFGIFAEGIGRRTAPAALFRNGNLATSGKVDRLARLLDPVDARVSCGTNLLHSSSAGLGSSLEGFSVL